MSLRAEYDDWHNKYHELDPSYDDASSPWYSWARVAVGEVQGQRTLEVACGRGGFVRALARNGAQAFGLDFSMAAVRIGKERSLRSDSESGAAFIQGDAHALPFPDNCFDILVSCETIEHLQSPVESLREFHRVTRPGGRLLLTTPNYFNLLGLYEVYSRFRHSGRKRDQPLDRLQIFTQTRKLLRKAGWNVLGTDGVVHQIPLSPGRNPYRLQFLDSNVYLRKLLRIFALHYCVIATKTGS